MSASRIVGICLVRNEEIYLGQMLANIYEFCDEILIADNGSTDSTWRIATEWAQKRPKIQCRQIRHPSESHRMIEPFVNTPTWVFGVDGDELYDPCGLESFRKEIAAGLYDPYWMVSGGVLNCTRIDKGLKTAQGYLSPPSRNITKFYNFSAISEWSDVPGERLHGGRVVYKPGYGGSRRCPLHKQKKWEESLFRCLHLCFLPRSNRDSVDKDGRVTRWNLAEQQARGPLIRMYSAVLRQFGISRASPWKNDRYARGSLVSSPIQPFFDRAPRP